MPFARIDLIQGKAPAYRATLADIVYRGIVDVLKAPDGDRFIVINEHTPDNLIYDPTFLGWKRSADFLLIQVTSNGRERQGLEACFLPLCRRRAEGQAVRSSRRYHDQHGLC